MVCGRPALLKRWTWAPISAPRGHRLYAIGVFEVEYRYAHPTYVWHSAPAELNSALAGGRRPYP